MKMVEASTISSRDNQSARGVVTADRSTPMSSPVMVRRSSRTSAKTLDTSTLLTHQRLRSLPKPVKVVGGPGEPQPPGHFLDHVEIGRDRRTAETVEFGLGTAERRHDPTLDLADAEVTLVPRATGTVGVDDDLQQRQRIE